MSDPADMPRVLLGLARDDELAARALLSLSNVDRLSPYGVQLRYGSLSPGDLDRDEALRWAATAVEWAQSIIEVVGD
jgi:hypothetical protein